MEKHRAIPEGYMRIGELAKKAGISINTLRYYDRENLLAPSAESEGGYRLYTDKDMAKLIQILMMKQLGFELAEIKKRLTSLDTTADVVNVLTEHATNIRSKVKQLSESLDEIETLKAEILQMDSVDFKKFATILAALRMKSANYWMIKHFDNDVMEWLGESSGSEKGDAVAEVMNYLFDKAVELQRENVAPESEKGQNFAKEYWEKVMEATDGDMSLVQRISDQVVKITRSDESRGETFMVTHRFIHSALETYFNKMYLFDKAAKFQSENIAPESEEGQSFAKEFWEKMLEMTGGNMELMQKINEQVEKTISSGENQDEAFIASYRFIQSALETYFKNLY